MDNKCYYIVILCFGFVCSCKQTVNTPISEDHFTVSGFVSNSTNQNAIEGVLVVIDDRSDTTDMVGKYEIENISKGRHTIKAIHTYYYQKDRTIVVDKNTVINFELTPMFTIPNGYSMEVLVSDRVTLQGIKGAVIGMGGWSFITDAEGRIKFYNLDKGIYNLEIEQSFYSPKDTLIALDHDLVVHLLLDPIIGDYFPIDYGRLWKFQYSSYWYSPGKDGIFVEAEDQWEVVEKIPLDTLTTYTISRKLNGIQYKKGFWDGVPYDTTQIIDQFTSFQILEKSNGIVHIDLYATMHYTIIDDFPRMNPVSIGDTLSIIRPHVSKVLFVKSVGLVYYDWYWSSNTKIGYESFLIESY
jgi:hypothetical protein